MSYLEFPRIATMKKTPEFGVISQGMTLGWIKWYAQWRKLCFFPTPGTLFDASCLTEILVKVKLEDAEYKRKRAVLKAGGR